MITLSQVKQELGISDPDGGDDLELIATIRQVIGRIRAMTFRGIAWLCDHTEVADGKTTLRVINHGFRTGQTVKIAGSGNNLLDAVHTVTVIDANTLRVDVSAADGLSCSVHPLISKTFRPLYKNRVWVPETLTPLLEVVSLRDKTGDNEWTLVPSGDYVVGQQLDVKAVPIERINGQFVLPRIARRGQYALRTMGVAETAKIEVYAGADIVPSDIQLAALSLACDLYELAGRGKDEADSSFEDESRKRMTGDERREHLLSPDPIIRSWIAR